MKIINNEGSLLSPSNTKLLRVVFEVMVLIHHLYLVYTSFGGAITNDFGPIAVGGFIFLSGFGVGFSFIKKGEEYAKRLLKVRIPRTYLILLIADLCYLVLYLARGEKFNSPFSAIVSVLYLPIFSDFVYLSHWIYFLADLLIYYFMFLLFIFIFKKAKNKLLWTAITILIIDLIIIAVLSVINYQTGSVRYLRACLCFPIGLICAVFSGKLYEIVKKHKIILAVSLSAIIILISAFLDYRPIDEYVLPIFVVLALVVILCGVNTKCKALDYLSGLVIYVYVSHEFFLLLFSHIFSTLNINLHKNIIGLIVVACSMLFAVILNAIVKKVLKLAHGYEKSGEKNKKLSYHS